MGSSRGPLMRSCCLKKRTTLHLAARQNFCYLWDSQQHHFLQRLFLLPEVTCVRRGPGWWALLAIEVCSLLSVWKRQCPQLLAMCASLVMYSCKPIFVQTWAFIHWLGKCLGDWLEDSWASAQICLFRLSKGGPRIHMLRENLEVICYAPPRFEYLIYF